jgi:acetolactate synthase-1/2/3 large subunit
MFGIPGAKIDAVFNALVDSRLRRWFCRHEQNAAMIAGLLASKPANAAALREFIGKNHLPVVGTFQAAGAVAAHLFENFGGRVGQLANQPGDRLLDSADLVVTIGYDPVEYPPGDWNRNNDRKIIHIDVQGADLDNAYRPFVELTGDIASTLKLLTAQGNRPHRSDLAAMILKAIAAERAQLSHESASRSGTPIHSCGCLPNYSLCLVPM